MDNFLPTDYEVPKSQDKYIKFEKDSTVEFLPLESAIVGYEYWNLNDKPVRLRQMPETMPSDIKPDKGGNKKIGHFWAFPVIEVDSGRVKVLEITQKTIQRAILAYVKNNKWGNPVMRYTFSITRDDSTDKTTYTTMANPAVEIPKEWTDTWAQAKAEGFDINRLYTGGDPFTPSEDVTVQPVE